MADPYLRPPLLIWVQDNVNLQTDFIARARTEGIHVRTFKTTAAAEIFISYNISNLHLISSDHL